MIDNGSDSRVVAGIVTYNPEIERLEKNINAIITQVSSVVIVDNNSHNINDIIALADKSKIYVIANDANRGIAYALNQIMEYAEQNDAKWCVTLDQDSVSPANLVSEAKEAIDFPNIGLIAPVILESVSNELCFLGEKDNGAKYQEVKKAITSASITNVDAWRTIGKFDEGLFIDYVDYDFVIRLKKYNYRIIRMNQCILNHQLGNSSMKSFGKLRIRTGNHSNMRKYYITRNMIIYIRRYWKDIDLFKEILRFIKVFLMIILFENDKKNKINSCIKGVKDGINYNI